MSEQEQEPTLEESRSIVGRVVKEQRAYQRLYEAANTIIQHQALEKTLPPRIKQLQDEFDGVQKQHKDNMTSLDRMEKARQAEVEVHRKALDAKQAEMALEWQDKFATHEQRVKALTANIEKFEREAKDKEALFLRQGKELEQEHARKKQALEVETVDLTRQVADLRRQLGDLVEKVNALAG